VIAMKNFSVMFRVDASLEIGTGHVMRCLTLADLLCQRGAICLFVCRLHDGNMIDAIRRRGYFVHGLSVATQECSAHDETRETELAHAYWLGGNWHEDAKETCSVIGGQVFDWLIVDHYGLDVRWEQLLRPSCRRLLVIDDLADRPHDCDVLLDQNLGRHPVDYANLVDVESTKLIGPNFALLRPEFARRRALSNRLLGRKSSRRILISLGGVDKDNVTGVVLDALRACALPSDARLTVVLGERAPWVELVRKQAATMPWPTEILQNVQDMASLMDEADLAIGAAGGSAWERCCMGLPTLLVSIAENQKRGALALAASGAGVLLGEMSGVAAGLIKEMSLLMSGQGLKLMTDAAASICDGRGAERVASVLQYLSNERLVLRRAKESDVHLFYQWVNDPVTRSNALNTQSIGWDTHQSWFQEKLAHPEDCQIIVAELSEGMPCGQVRFERDPDSTWFIDYSLAPEFRGLGLGRPLLNTALSFLCRSVPNAVVMGQVKIENVPSQRVFESLGFHRDTALVDGLIVYRRNLLNGFANAYDCFGNTSCAE